MPRAKKTRRSQEQVLPKEVFAQEIARILEEEGLTQTEAAFRAKDAPSQISLVVSGKLNGFSSERLVRLLVNLGRDVEIGIRKTRGDATGKVRVSVK